MTLKIALGVFIGIVILVVGFAFFIPQTDRRGDTTLPVEAPMPTPEVSITDSYSKGVHTISGRVMAPSPCTTISAEALVASGTPAVIRLDLLMPADTGLCLQEITPLTFKVTASAPASAIIEATVNGIRASTTGAMP